jgi:hypothetical protein
VFGLNVKTFGGLDRAFSHNASDPLHSSNLPAWCDVTAVDAFDVACILQFGGDRDRAFRELGERFGLTKAAARKSLSRLLFNLIRQRTSPTELDHQAKTEGIRLGLTAEEINSVKKWVSEQGVTVTGRAA